MKFTLGRPEMKIKNPCNKMFKVYQLLLPALAVIITISIIRFPDEAFKSALNGLDVWFTIVCQHYFLFLSVLNF